MIDPVEPSISELISRIDMALAEDDVEVAALKQEVSALRQQLAAMREVEADKSQAEREAELTLSQLHESQQELQHYYLLCQKQSEMLEANAKLQARSFDLLAGVIS